MKGFARSWPKWLIAILPLWLVVSGGVGLFLHFRHQEQDAFEQQRVFRREAQLSSLADDWRKFEQVIGARSELDVDQRLALRRAASMLEGALGTTNMGYAVNSYAGPKIEGDNWPVLTVSTRDAAQGAPIWVIFSYDTAEGATAVEEGSATLALSLAIAQSLVGEDLTHPIRLMWVPHGRTRSAGHCEEMLGKVKTILSASSAPLWVLVMDDLRGAESLSIASAVDSAVLQRAGYPSLPLKREQCQLFSTLMLERQSRTVVCGCGAATASTPAQMVSLCGQIADLLRRLALEK